MFNRLKNRVLTTIVPDIPSIHQQPLSYANRALPDKFQYQRPDFLQLLTTDELKASADHNVRPIIVPRDIAVMPWNTGYAECVNSGKSEWNEDQAAFKVQVLHHPSKELPDLPYTYFGIFDGHAGYGASLAASLQFQHILHEKLVDILELLLPSEGQKTPTFPAIMFHKTISKDELIVGALESAFYEMDAMLAEDRTKYRNAGGCTSVVTLFILGSVYVANAGDSRAILAQKLSKKVIQMQQRNQGNHYQRNGVVVNGNSNIDEANDEFQTIATPFSFDHTPDTERGRILSLGKQCPHLLGGEYIALEYAKKPLTRDLGTRILYKQGNMKGWTYKTLTKDDLRMPIVTGEGKRSRLLGTIGVTRGFGDHDLKALYSGVLIKPFLSCHPEVVYRDLSMVISFPDDNNFDGEYGVLIMATDGLWDVLDNETVSRIAFQTLSKYPNEKHRYTMAAQELVAKSRGRANESGHWRLADLKAPATVDDISVLVIPLYQYYREFCEWEKQFFDAQEQRKRRAEAALRRAEEMAAAAAAASANGNSVSIDEDAEEAHEVDDVKLIVANGTDDDDDDDNEDAEESAAIEEKLDRITLTDETNESSKESTA